MVSARQADSAHLIASLIPKTLHKKQRSWGSRFPKKKKPELKKCRERKRTDTAAKPIFNSGFFLEIGGEAPPSRTLQRAGNRAQRSSVSESAQHRHPGVAQGGAAGGGCPSAEPDLAYSRAKRRGRSPAEGAISKGRFGGRAPRAMPSGMALEPRSGVKARGGKERGRARSARQRPSPAQHAQACVAASTQCAQPKRSVGVGLSGSPVFAPRGLGQVLNRRLSMVC